MQTDYLIWSSYAIIFNDRGEVLMRQAATGERLWGLPGGQVDLDKSPAQNLHSRLDRELGLRLKKVTGRMGNPLPYSFEKSKWLHIAEAFCCEVTGQPQVTLESGAWGWWNQCKIMDAVVVGINPHPSPEQAGDNRLARMLLDAASIGQQPVKTCRTGGDKCLIGGVDLPVCTDYQIVGGGRHLVKVTEDTTTVWRRLDPFSASGYMESA